MLGIAATSDSNNALCRYSKEPIEDLLLSFFSFFPRARTRSAIVTKTMSHKAGSNGCQMFQVCFVKSWFKRDPVSATTMMATMESTKEREGPSTTSTMAMAATAATTERKGLSTTSTASVAVGAAITTNERGGLSTTSTVTLGASITTTETKGLSTVSTVAVGATEVSTTGRRGLSLAAEAASADPEAVSAVSTRQEKVYLDKKRCI